MLRPLIAIGLLIVAALAIILYMVGSHGHLTFRPHMTEDWVIWGVVVISAVSGIYLLIPKNSRN